MKTFVVERILCSYSCGLIVVKAENKDEAIKLIASKIRPSLFYEDKIEELKSKIRELNDNEVVYVEGG